MQVTVVIFVITITIRYLPFFLAIPENVGASNWNLSMEHCRNLEPSTYLFGDINLNRIDVVCEHIMSDIQVFWVGVARQIHTSIDQGKYQDLLLTRFSN